MNTPSLREFQSRFFFRFLKLEQWGLIHRSASSYCVRSNTAPAFAGWPCVWLKPAWRSTSACLFCTLCSPGGVVSAACTALIDLELCFNERKYGFILKKIELLLFDFGFVLFWTDGTRTRTTRTQGPCNAFENESERLVAVGASRHCH